MYIGLVYSKQRRLGEKVLFPALGDRNLERGLILALSVGEVESSVKRNRNNFTFC